MRFSYNEAHPPWCPWRQGGGGGLGGPGVRWRVDRDDVASVFPRQRAALLALAGRSPRARHLSSLIVALAPPRVGTAPPPARSLPARPHPLSSLVARVGSFRMPSLLM